MRRKGWFKRGFGFKYRVVYRLHLLIRMNVEDSSFRLTKLTAT